MKRLSFCMFMIFIVGCSADQMNRGQTWLQTPVTTQPNAPTHQQVIQGTADTVGAIGGPYGLLIASLINAGLITYSEIASRSRAAKTQGLVVASAPPDSPLAMGIVPAKIPEVTITPKL